MNGNLLPLPAPQHRLSDSQMLKNNAEIPMIITGTHFEYTTIKIPLEIFGK